MSGPAGTHDGTAEGATRWDALARAAARREAVEAGEVQHEYLAFRLGDVPYAIAVDGVREIVRMRPVTPVPRVPPEVSGVISLRGEIVQVVDLRRRLGMPEVEPSRSTRIIVLHGDVGEVSGVQVDGVTEVLRVVESDLRPPPSGESEFVSSICEREGRFVSVMNMQKVLDLGGS
ncbi:MAG: chemotaxis protein CheW [Myxococcota bacterium]|nr:chemotaxis protein CheW [Myxococcota bacterium]